MTKTGNFETDVNTGYYRWERENSQERTFDGDFSEWLFAQGVPEQYINRLASYAYSRGHSHGEEQVLNISYELVYIFTGN